MLGVRRGSGAPTDPVAPVITRETEIIVTEPVALMRELAITGRARDDCWLQAFLAYASDRVGVRFTEADLHPVSDCWPVDADRYHLHIRRLGR